MLLRLFLALNSHELYIVTANERLLIYDLNSFQQINSITIPDGWNWNLTFGDVNNDGEDELVIGESDQVIIMNNDFEIITNIMDSVLKPIKIENVDEDSNNELIFSGVNGIHIYEIQNDNSYQLEYENNSTTSHFDIFDYDADGIYEIAFSQESSLKYYSAVSNSIVWELDASFEINQFRFFDQNNDGNDDVFLSGENIVCFDGVTKDELFVLYTSDDPDFMEIFNVDDDSEFEILVSIDIASSAKDRFSIYGVETNELEWFTFSRDMSRGNFSFGDIDNDGDLEIMTSFNADGSSTIGFDCDPKLLIHDAQTKSFENEIAFNIPNSQSIIDYSKILIADINGDNQNEIILGVQYDFPFLKSTSVYIFDANFSLQTEFMVPGVDVITQIEVADLDLDGNLEIVVAGGSNSFSSVGGDEVYIFVFDIESQTLEYQSPLLAGGVEFITSLMVENIDNDDFPEIVATKEDLFGGNGSLIVIDGGTFETIIKEDFNYFSIDLFDYFQDGKKEIICGTSDGEILLIDGITLEPLEEIQTGISDISTIRVFDLNSDGINEIVFTDFSKLYVLDFESEDVILETERLGFNIGLFNNMRITNPNLDETSTVYIHTSQALLEIDLSINGLTSSKDLVEDNKSVLFFPNPTTGNINFRINSDLPPFKLELLNAMQQQVLSYEYPRTEAGFQYALNVSNIPNGIYFFKVSGETFSTCQKIIIQD